LPLKAAPFVRALHPREVGAETPSFTSTIFPVIGVVIAAPKEVLGIQGYTPATPDGLFTVKFEAVVKMVAPEIPPKTLAQVAPPFIDFQTPSPPASPPVQDSPVPT
jgi:hypothetical protein